LCPAQTSGELTEGKHTWKVNAYDTASNETSSSQDFYIDRTQPSISDLVVADTFQVSPHGEIKLTLSNATPSFFGKAVDSYQGSEVKNNNETVDTFDESLSAPDKITINIQKLGQGKTPQSTDPGYTDHLTEEFTLSNIKDDPGNEKYANFHLTPSKSLVNGYYKVNVELKDQAGNSYDYSPFYLSLNYNRPLIFPPGQLKTEKIKEGTIPTTSEEEKEEVRKKGKVITVKVVDEDGNPFKGAKVTLFSEPKIAYTNDEGIATFEGVEDGEHTVKISYKGYDGEEKLTVSGGEEVKSIALTTQITLHKEWYETPVVYIFSLGIVVFSAIAVSVYLKKKNY
jgi:hypothetical protein